MLSQERPVAPHSPTQSKFNELLKKFYPEKKKAIIKLPAPNTLKQCSSPGK